MGVRLGGERVVRGDGARHLHLRQLQDGVPQGAPGRRPLIRAEPRAVRQQPPPQGGLLGGHPAASVACHGSCP